MSLTPGNLPANLVTERLVPVCLSPDSALLAALFECDSNSRVILKAYDDLKSAGMESSLSFNDGKLEYKAKAGEDTVYVPAKDSIVYVPQLVEVEVNRLTWWQQAWIYIGKFLSSLVAVTLLCFLIVKRIKN